MIDGIGPHNNTPPNIMKQDLENDGKYNKLIFDFIAKNDGNEDNNFTRKEINLYNKIINWVKKYNISDDKIQELIKNPGKILNFITNKKTPEPTSAKQIEKKPLTPEEEEYVNDCMDIIKGEGMPIRAKINCVNHYITLRTKMGKTEKNDGAIKELNEKLKELKIKQKELEEQEKLQKKQTETDKAKIDNNEPNNNIETNIPEENPLLTLDQTNPELAQNDKSPKEDEGLF